MSRQGVNSVTILGNLGRDPELRETKSGMAVASFSVAVNQSVKVGEGYEDRLEWVNVTVFSRRAEVCAQYLSKGSSVFVEGKLSTTSWESEGIKRWSTSVIARNVIFLSDKGKSQRQDRPPAPPQDDDGGEYTRSYGGFDEMGEDGPLPF